MRYKLPVDHDLMVNAAVRYALGRRAYIVLSIVDYIVNNYDMLTDRCKDVIVKDIKDAIKRKDLGSKCDGIRWMALKRFIENMEGQQLREETCAAQKHDTKHEKMANFVSGTIGERIIEREFDYEDMEARNTRD